MTVHGMQGVWLRSPVRSGIMPDQTDECSGEVDVTRDEFEAVRAAQRANTERLRLVELRLKALTQRLGLDDEQ